MQFESGDSSGIGVQNGLGVSVCIEGSSVCGSLAGAFSYDGPVVTGAYPRNIPSMAGVPVTIYGTNFGMDNAGSNGGQATVNGDMCSSSLTWISNTAIACVTTGLSEGTSLTSVTVSPLSARAGPFGSSLSDITFTIDAAIVTAILPANAPTQGPAVITLLGTNFGTSDPSATAYFGSTMAAATRWVSLTSSLAYVGSGSGVGAKITLGVGLSTPAAEYYLRRGQVFPRTRVTPNLPSSRRSDPSQYYYGYSAPSPADTPTTLRRNQYTSSQWQQFDDMNGNSGTLLPSAGKASFKSQVSSAGTFDYIDILASPGCAKCAVAEVPISFDDLSPSNLQIDITIGGDFRRMPSATPIFALYNGNSFYGFKIGSASSASSGSFVTGSGGSGELKDIIEIPGDTWGVQPGAGQTPQALSMTFSFGEIVTNEMSNVPVTLTTTASYLDAEGRSQIQRNTAVPVTPFTTGTLTSLSVLVIRNLGMDEFTVSSIGYSICKKSEFTFDGPVVESVSPQVIARSPGQVITLTGKNFATGTYVAPVPSTAVEWSATPSPFIALPGTQGSPDTCGKQLVLTQMSGAITDGPADYIGSTSGLSAIPVCSWLIVPSGGQPIARIQLDFLEMDVEAGYDFIDVSVSGESIARLSGTNLWSKTIDCSQFPYNCQVSVELYADMGLQGKGFTATYSAEVLTAAPIPTPSPTRSPTPSPTFDPASQETGVPSQSPTQPPTEGVFWMQLMNAGSNNRPVEQQGEEYKQTLLRNLVAFLKELIRISQQPTTATMEVVNKLLTEDQDKIYADDLFTISYIVRPAEPASNAIKVEFFGYGYDGIEIANFIARQWVYAPVDADLQSIPLGDYTVYSISTSGIAATAIPTVAPSFAPTVMGEVVGVTAVPTALGSCSGVLTLTALSGALSDGPGEYSANQYCVWKIDRSDIPTAVSITLTLTMLETEATYDFFEVFDGDEGGDSLSGKLSGSEISMPLSFTASKSAFMTVKFVADQSVDAAGFDAVYTMNTPEPALVSGRRLLSRPRSAPTSSQGLSADSLHRAAARISSSQPEPTSIRRSTQKGRALLQASVDPLYQPMFWGGGDEVYIVSVGGIPCVVTAPGTPTTLVCTTISGSYDGSTRVMITANGVSGGSTDGAFKWAAPVVSGAEPANGPTTGGAVVTIFGSGFGTSDPGMLILVGDTACSSSAWLSESSALCVIPGGFSSQGTRTSVRLGSAVGTAMAFQYDAPVITAISACPQASMSSCSAPAFSPFIEMPQSGDGSFTIFGFNFGPPSASGSISAALADRTCQVSTWYSENVASCTLGPSGATASAVTTVSLTVGVATGTSLSGLYSFQSNSMRVSTINPLLGQSLQSPGGPMACDFASTMVYVSDTLGQQIWAVHMSSGSATSIAGDITSQAGYCCATPANGPLSLFRNPMGITGPRSISGFSVLFVADTQNSMLRALILSSPTTVSSVMSMNSTDFTTLSAVVLSPSAPELYVANNDQIKKVVITGISEVNVQFTVTRVQEYQGQGSLIRDLAIDVLGNRLYISQYGQREIVVVDLQTKTQSTLASNGYNILAPTGLSFASGLQASGLVGEFLFVAEQSYNRLSRVNVLDGMRSDILIGYQSEILQENTIAASASSIDGPVFRGNPPNEQYPFEPPYAGVVPYIDSTGSVPSVGAPVALCASSDGSAIYFMDSLNGLSLRKLQIVDTSGVGTASALISKGDAEVSGDATAGSHKILSFFAIIASCGAGVLLLAGISVAAVRYGKASANRTGKQWEPSPSQSSIVPMNPDRPPDRPILVAWGEPPGALTHEVDGMREEASVTSVQISPVHLGITVTDMPTEPFPAD